MVIFFLFIYLRYFILTSIILIFFFFSGKDRNLNIAELLCASCSKWFHESCIGYQLGKLVPFMMNYVFMCKNCSQTGLESFKKNQARELVFFYFFFKTNNYFLFINLTRDLF